MKAVDTNILIHLITQDEPAQAAIADGVSAAGDILILPTVLLETEWVLRSSYGFSRERIVSAIMTLCGADGIRVVSEAAVLGVLVRYSVAGDFADLMHVALAAEQDAMAFVTFDRHLPNNVSNDLLIEVV